MKNIFDPFRFIEAFVHLGERQLIGEKKAANLLQHLLKTHHLPFALEKFSTDIPVTKKVRLLADGKQVDCAGCGLVSGMITDKHTIVSSAMPSSYFSDAPNISINPSCPVISRGNHYNAPALAVTHAALHKILKAKTIKGTLQVKKAKHGSVNILLGNTRAPQSIVFAHYDSIGPGAIDNASGVAVALCVAIEHPEVLVDSLIVLAGNEELSYEMPFYWGHGYRAFQKMHSGILTKAKEILVVDSVGNGKTIVTKDSAIVPRAFPLKNMEHLRKKITLLTGDINHLMTVYHSELDDGRGIQKKHLLQAKDLLLSLLLK